MVPTQTLMRRMFRLALPLAMFPAALVAQPAVLVDAIPTGGAFLGASPIGMPFHDAEKTDIAAIGPGLSSAVAGILQTAEKNGISYICLLSTPGDNPIEVFIAPAKAELKLARKNTQVMAVFFRGGSLAPTPVVYTTGRPDPKKALVSVKFQKISVPEGVTTAGWVYFDLTRVQAEALKAGSPTVFLQVDGAGPVSPVPIPGMKDPLMMFDGRTTFTASWYMSAEMEAAHERQVKGK